MYASSLTGGGGTRSASAPRCRKVAQQFSQGNITASNNPLDIAINGGGFFRMATTARSPMRRNGQFQLDKSGYIVNARARP